MNECPIYYTSTDTTGLPSPPNDVKYCAGCNCGYLQFESLVPYLKEINNQLREDQEDFNNLEFKLRQEIIEISRLFDIEAGVSPGYFSTAHYKSTKVITSNGTKYLKVADFIPGTLTLRTIDDYIIDPDSYRYENKHLVFLPCVEHSSIGCTGGCLNSKSATAWPNSCYKLTAKWGQHCADYAVQMAIRDYLIEKYRLSDPVKVLVSGLPVQMSFRVPHSWEMYLRNFKQKRRLFSQFAIA